VPVGHAGWRVASALGWQVLVNEVGASMMQAPEPVRFISPRQEELLAVRGHSLTADEK
jgi:hypothetical protein